MKQDLIHVADVAQLARLQLSPEETTKFQSQLGQMLSYVQQLSTLHVDGIEPTAHAVSRVNVFRPDELHSSHDLEKNLQNAPQRVHGLFKVPKVVE